MTLPDNEIKEALSISYIQAICGMAGCTYSQASKDYGMDITIKDIKRRQSGKYNESGYRIDFQLKATVNYQITDTHVKYSLRNKNYNDLADTDVGTPRILVVLILPKNKSEWLNQDVNSLIIQKCAFWICLKGETQRDNEESSTVLNIPIQNIFSVEILNSMMETIKNGGDLNDFQN